MPPPHDDRPELKALLHGELVQRPRMLRYTQGAKSRQPRSHSRRSSALGTWVHQHRASPRRWCPNTASSAVFNHHLRQCPTANDRFSTRSTRLASAPTHSAFPQQRFQRLLEMGTRGRNNSRDRSTPLRYKNLLTALHSFQIPTEVIL